MGLIDILGDLARNLRSTAKSGMKSGGYTGHELQNLKNYKGTQLNSKIE